MTDSGDTLIAEDEELSPLDEHECICGFMYMFFSFLLIDINNQVNNVHAYA